MFHNDVLDFTGKRRYATAPAQPRIRKHFPKPGFQPKPVFRPLEEHFENFGEVVGEETEYFFKKIKAAITKMVDRRAQIKDKKKLSKADKIQAQADATRITAQADADARRIEAQSLADERRAAANQASTTQQLASSVTPGMPPVTMTETPMYQTLPSGNTLQPANANEWRDVVEETPISQQAAPPPAAVTAAAAPAKAKSKTTMYIIIAVVVIAVIYFFMKNRKK